MTLNHSIIFTLTADFQSCSAVIVTMNWCRRDRTMHHFTSSREPWLGTHCKRCCCWWSCGLTRTTDILGLSFSPFSSMTPAVTPLSQVAQQLWGVS